MKEEEVPVTLASAVVCLCHEFRLGGIVCKLARKIVLNMSNVMNLRACACPATATGCLVVVMLGSFSGAPRTGPLERKVQQFL